MKAMGELFQDLNQYIKSKNVQGSIKFHKEDARLVRCGRNQISVNTKQVGGSLLMTLQQGKKSIEREYSGTHFDSDQLKNEVDEMISAFQYLPEKDYLKNLQNQGSVQGQYTFIDHGIDKDRSHDMVLFFKSVFDNFKDNDVEVSGAFTMGNYGYQYIDTTMDESIYHESSDFHVEVVLQLIKNENKELKVSQTGETWNQFDGEKIIRELKTLHHVKTTTPRKDLEPKRYNVVFSTDAFAELVVYMSYVSLYGESMLFKSGMVSEDKHPIGSKLFSDKFTLSDNPHDEDIIFKRFVTPTGLIRENFPLIERGVLKNLYFSDKDSCDMFDREVNNHFGSANFKVHPGNGPSDFDELVKSIKEPVLYIGHLHYLNFTNPTKGEFTGTSRFGTFLIENGEVKSHLYNLRLNDDFFNLFNNIEWLSKELGHCSVSSSYGLRWPFAVTAPKFVQINGVNITATSSQD